MTEELRKYNDKTFRLYLQGDEFYLTEDDIALLQSLVFKGVAETDREIESLAKLQKIFREV
ncbi:TPA: hypothetical protein TXJ05_002321 [Streptococcus suis]|nr:hypothetical protein [Streptococcus pasteurianus]HEL1558082.1 hypothetical protein [Streptococcus suis]